MKTPMQQMHDFLFDELARKDSWRDYPHIENAILKCEELMEEEKQQIMAAYDYGHEGGTNYWRRQTAKEYYNETFD